MADRRRYTGTQMLQAIWTVFALSVGALIQFLEPVVGGLLRPSVFITVSGVWVAGLVLLALSDRRHWNRMVEHSSFEHERSTRLADLETIKKGRSIAVTTTVPNIFSQTHLEVRTPVEGVDASFIIRIAYVGSGGRDTGLKTGTATLDESFVIEGAEQNVARLLSLDIQTALLDIETPGTYTITGNYVAYDIPFTRLSATELETIAETTVALAERVEELASSDT